MSKVAVVVSGLIGLSAVACASAPSTPTRVAQATPSQTSDVTPAIGRAQTLAATAATAGTAGTPATVSIAEQPAEGQTNDAASIPTSCGAAGTLKTTQLCLPEPAYAKKLCGGTYPEVALGLFGRGTPWTRVYLAGDVEAWNATGGRTHRTKLAFDEEVLVLGKHGASSAGGIVMTGAQASYDVLRWDGTCVSVMEGELTTRRPPAPKPAEVPFRRLEETTRHALLAAPKVRATHETLDKKCLSVATPSEKKACDKADKVFSLAIVDAIRSGGAPLPAPARRP